MPVIKGIAVAPGLAMGRVYVVRAREGAAPLWNIREDEVAGEIERLGEALRASSEQLEHQQEVVREAAGEKDAGIFAVHRMILADPSALEAVERRIREERINAEAAIQTLIDRLRGTMDRLEGANVRRYGADVSEPWLAVLDHLMQRGDDRVAAMGDRLVLAAAELTPQVVTFLARDRILAVVTETGGRFSHGAVLARSFAIPCVVGLPNLLARLEQGMETLVDGDAGTVQLRPDSEAVDQFLVQRQRREERREAIAAHADLPARTPDGELFDVQVNVESVRDLDTFDLSHCDGVGLLRTEFLYMERSEFPSEEEQFRLYRRVVERMGDKPVTLRTLDIGGDKQLPYFKTPREPNPALGWRGIRIALEWQDLLRVQMRAALRASAFGRVRLLLPMITSLEEVRAVNKIFDGVREQLTDQGYEVAEDLPLGIMVEVPSSIWTLDQIAAEVDFVSVGTNDLVQYLLAVDRDNPLVAKSYEPRHPAVMRALAQIIKATEAAGVPCSVCGEIAGDYAMAMLLGGMGYRSLSMSSNLLPEVRYAIRTTSMDEARALARSALAASTCEEVRGILAGARDRLHSRLLEKRAGAAESASPDA